METLTSVITALHPGDWLAAIDLKDAYFHVPIHQYQWKYLRFAIQGKVYQYRVLPFGLTTSPRVFTKILAPVMGFIREMSIQVHPFLDDILIVAESLALLHRHVQTVMLVLMDAGYLINVKKSHLVPSQDLVFLGAWFQPALNLVSLPLQRQRIQFSLCQSSGWVCTYRQEYGYNCWVSWPQRFTWCLWPVFIQD